MSFIPAQAFKEIARGNVDAEKFMGAFYCWVHMRDDLVDKDKVVPAETVVGFDLQLLNTFARNPFFQKHQDFLWPVIHMSALAWIASEDYSKNPDVIEQFGSQILKSQYMDVFFAVAFCIGGFDHAVAMSRAYRDYHFDLVKPADLAQTI